MNVLDLAIVTSVHNYGQYLEDWARSIVAQEGFYPSVVTIVDNGSTDGSPHQIVAAAEILRVAGIPCKIQRMPYANFGAARNRAVELSGETEWVMHFDADDTLMPHALKDTAELMPRADVIGFGYQRSGDLSAGPRNRTRIYSSHRGEQTLKSTAPCSGVSPFRRRFWKASPYRDDMRGGWDTALWIGFAHQDARFVATKTPVFYYRQHADSVFNKRRLVTRKGRLVGTKLNNLRKKITDGVSVIIPVSPDDGARDRSREWVMERYAKMHPSWEIVEGRLDPMAPWCKGEAVMKGVKEASHHTLVIADSDCFIDPSGLEEAVARLRDEDVGWIVPHGLVHRLDKATSAEAMSVMTSPVSYERAPYTGYVGGGIVVVDRSDYEAVGGIPQTFHGWGAEDECLALILDTLVGPHVRLDHDLWHLWHPTARKENVKNNRMNRLYLRIFAGFRDDPDAMWELIQHVQIGKDPKTFNPVEGSNANSVLMKAIETHQRGREVVAAGDYFRVSLEEARRYSSRPRKIALPVNGSVLEVQSQLRQRR